MMPRLQTHHHFMPVQAPVKLQQESESLSNVITASLNEAHIEKTVKIT